MAEMTVERFKQLQFGDWKMSRPTVKVLCLSIWYPMAISRYFEKALRHNSQVELLTTGPYTGTWIPWLRGMNLQPKYAVQPDIALPFPPNVQRVDYSLVRAKLPDGWIPDIVLTIDAGICWRHKPHEGLVVHVATDPHALNYDYQRTISDKFFNMQRYYSKSTDIYLPYAYSTYDHYPMPEVQKDTDAVLIGMPYDQRVQWVDALRKKGVSVIFENGPVYDEARVLYNRGRIGLNWSSLYDLNARCFEIAAMKLCPVVNNVPDAHEMDIFKRFLAFDNLGGAVEGVLWAKNNPKDAQVIAEHVYKQIQPHSYDARVGQILTECGF